jgi:hypothetical protein
MRWLLITLAAFVVFNGLRAWLTPARAWAPARRLLEFKLFGREWYVPMASSLVLSLGCSM